MSEAPSAEAVAGYHRALEPFWHPVLATAELGAGPVGVELLDRRLVLARLEGEVVCFPDLCRHFGSALSIGEVLEDRHLRCAYHGWTYDREGRVVDIPARRGAPIPREAKVPRHQAREAYGLVWVCLADTAAAPLPDFPEHGDPGFRKTPVWSPEPWAASAPRIVMGSLDDTHFAWVHPGLLGDREHPEPPDHRVSHQGSELVASYTILQPANASIGGQDGLERVEYHNHATPTTIRLVKSGPAGTYVILHAVSPLAWNRSRVFLVTARDFDTDPARDRHYLEFEERILAQDRRVVESQRPWLLPPLASRLMLYIRPADLPLIAFQRWLEELGVPQV